MACQAILGTGSWFTTSWQCCCCGTINPVCDPGRPCRCADCWHPRCDEAREVAHHEHTTAPEKDESYPLSRGDA